MLRQTCIPSLWLWETILPLSRFMMVHEDNQAMIRFVETGKNPTMRHMGRAHRIDVAWLCQRFEGDDVVMHKTCSQDMAADIFTKPFPDSKVTAWENDLKLIGIVDRVLLSIFDKAHETCHKNILKVDTQSENQKK